MPSTGSSECPLGRGNTTGYFKERCRCPECVDAAKAYRRYRTKARVTSIPAPPEQVDAAQRMIVTLRKLGYTLADICDHSTMHANTLSRLSTLAEPKLSVANARVMFDTFMRMTDSHMAYCEIYDMGRRRVTIPVNGHATVRAIAQGCRCHQCVMVIDAGSFAVSVFGEVP